MPSWPEIFQIGTFLSVALSKSRFTFLLGPSPCSSNSFFHVVYIFGFLCYAFSVPIFCSKIVLLPFHPVVGMSSYIFPLLAGWNFWLFWNVLFCLYCLILSSYLFILPSFASTFWFISLRCIVPFDCCVVFSVLVPTYSSVLTF